ncbi:hypothetical protein GOP47_0008755 [Adiantum capillus-veneris]|uniref:Uncharacterized protein n=1 Tax=Adiantum capillus-veneris TaxID=13818 RepID=A0A9D4ZL09_ADICA|nr:hypothetical protein GOP47_0008755 [Adiantum capillus-veneris]
MSPYLPPSLLQMLRPTSPDCTDKSTSDRHFVTWTDQEDEILRQAVSTYGVDKWSVIAAQFCNKTSRQCRRRWHTYLVTDCKKGGWSPEEDQLLLEAHQKFGNRWTEIAKMVPGRTDNAVKNRFSALGKKQAKKTSIHYIAEDLKFVSKRRVLEQNSNLCNKRMRGEDYSQPLQHNYNLAQQKLHQNQVKQALPKWTAEQSMADRAHPVHGERSLVSSMSRTMQNISIKGSPKCASFLSVEKSNTQHEAGSYSENVSPPRLAALSQNAALLESLVERRDARLKLWGNADDTWKSFDWYMMEDSGRILQSANFGRKNVSLGDMKSPLYKDKENRVDFYQIPFENQIPLAPPNIREPIHQPKHLSELGTATPTMQRERAWKSESNLDVCSSPSEERSYQVDDSTPLQTDCFSSYPLDQAVDIDDSTARQTGTSDAQYKGELKHDGKSAAAPFTTGAVDPSSIEFTWDSQFFMDDMPSPHFSDSEKQFLLSALDSNFPPSMLELHALCGNASMPSHCTS